MKKLILIAGLLFIGCDGIQQADSSCYCKTYEDGSTSCWCNDNEKESIIEQEKIAGNEIIDDDDMTIINSGERIYIWRQNEIRK